MPWVIKILGNAAGLPCKEAGLYVMDMDVDAYKGIGFLTCAIAPQRAKTFASPGAAMEYYRRTSKVTPLRPDGKPNRPLTAFNVEFLQV